MSQLVHSNIGYEELKLLLERLQQQQQQQQQREVLRCYRKLQHRQGQWQNTHPPEMTKAYEGLSDLQYNR